MEGRRGKYWGEETRGGLATRRRDGGGTSANNHGMFFLRRRGRRGVVTQSSPLKGNLNGKKRGLGDVERAWRMSARQLGGVAGKGVGEKRGLCG